ncbi:MAG: glycosyltransferase family 2 protein [bacterium]|nr:glycosyltransferase family 2 protein [bacterium]MDZ4342246.1 glycosyltransferase family 2 protein [Candidatus Binatia bacterium]
MSITSVTITKNEESNISRCLNGLNFVNQKIIVDSDSTDNTVDIAHTLGAQVIKQSWLGYGPQKNVGLKHASGEWVLFIDADEEVSPELANEIKTVTAKYKIQNTKYINYYWLKIVTVFLGKPLNHLYGHNLRLFKKDTARWTDDKVHEQVTRVIPSLRGGASGDDAAISKQQNVIHLGDQDTKILETPLLHYSHQTVKSYLTKMHHYTTLDASLMAETGRHRSGRKVSPSFFLPYYLALHQLIKLLFYRRGILDGWSGIVWCLLSAYYEFEMGNKYLLNVKAQMTNTKSMSKPK